MLIHFVYVLTIISIICVATANAQIGSDKSIKIYGVDASNSSKVKAFVSVVKAQRVRPLEEPFMGLSPMELNVDAFEIYVDGERINNIQAEVFDASPEGIDVVLAVDISGSVSENFDLVRKAINAYINKRREGKDQIAILTFGTDIQVPPELGESAFTDDVNKLKQAIEKKPPKERMQSTVLFKGTIKAIQLAAQGRLDQRSRPFEKAVILLSDGHEEGTGYTIENCIQKAQTQRIPIFALAVPEPKERNRHHGNLERMADATGGVFVSVNDLNRLEAVYQKLDELVKNRYVLNFKLPSWFADGKEHNLEISATHEGVVVSTITTFRSRRLTGRITREQFEQIKDLQKKRGWTDSKLNEFVEKFGTGKTVETLYATETDELIGSLQNSQEDDGNPTHPWWQKWWVWLIGGIVLVFAVVLVFSAIKMRLSKQYSATGA